MHKAGIRRKKRTRAVGIIPVRYESTRFPGKVLADIGGKPMIQHVWEKAEQALLLDALIVAADDQRVIDAVRSFGGQAVLTSPDHPSGTDRMNEAVQPFKTDIVINIQSDEPLLAPAMVDMLVTALSEDKNLLMATLRKRIRDEKQIRDAHTVKVVVDSRDFALYFSRSPIPCHRGVSSPATYYKHIGIYGYRKDFLSVFSSLPDSSLEAIEGLEQLRALENGYKIKVLETPYDTIGVDTPEDLEAVRRNLLSST